MQEFITIPIAIINELQEDKPYSKLGAYIDILNMANEGGGEFDAPRRKLENRWGWSGSKVNFFLSMLEKKTIIEPKKNQKKTTIKLVKSMVSGFSKTQKEPKKNQKRATENPENTEIYKRIIEHLNNRCGTKYKYENEDTTKFIAERLREGFTEENFYTVIDKKANEWIGTEWEQYLRPYTLFRKDKFENYLNQKAARSKSTGNAYLDAIQNRVSIVDTWMEDD